MFRLILSGLAFLVAILLTYLIACLFWFYSVAGEYAAYSDDLGRRIGPEVRDRQGPEGTITATGVTTCPQPSPVLNFRLLLREGHRLAESDREVPCAFYIPTTRPPFWVWQSRTLRCIALYGDLRTEIIPLDQAVQHLAAWQAPAAAP